MPNQKKVFTVQNLAEKVKQAKGLVLTDYSGLNVGQINQLRDEVKKAGGEYEVVKNNLLCLATKNSPLSLAALEGPTAALWIYQSDPAPLKALDKFIQQAELPKIKLGFWEGATISEEKISQLANLPGLNELRAKAVAVLLSPIAGLANALNWNIRKLILVLKNKQEIN
ncbi:50S ribosomal protein L10 [Candidatus Shapirobacteria bacterium CG09_land_8_20_14_0_10_49_15]|uniref:Large ribosomal subunit protein uL10 n=2 Tax=Candidatus Shapironibacteriota TaxID=1752721 RepID=A0A2M6XBK1_9BACT|nr:MAG: 50S ribosomal protein L10 [Candidatus Shapirobacteria bacterium CG09_land_8_20_14_0_10_49_15]